MGLGAAIHVRKTVLAAQLVINLDLTWTLSGVARKGTINLKVLPPGSLPSAT